MLSFSAINFIAVYKIRNNFHIHISEKYCLNKKRWNFVIVGFELTNLNETGICIKLPMAEEFVFKFSICSKGNGDDNAIRKNVNLLNIF